MTHLDLFSGIGGFAYVASQVFEDHKVVAFCEIDEYCQRVLGKHWPDAPIVADVRDVKAHPQAVELGIPTCDLLTGGFPCQPFSVAGKQAGRDDSRHLWPEMARCIEDFRPRWIVGENVAGILSMEDVLREILSDLGRLGYDTRIFVIPAAATGAQHRRDRVWFVAHRENERCERGEFDPSWQEDGRRRHSVSVERGSGSPDWAGGDWPQPWPVSEWFNRNTESDIEGAKCGVSEGSRTESDGIRGTVSADANGRRCEQRDAGQRGLPKPSKNGLQELEQIWPAECEFRRAPDGLSAGMDGYTSVRNRTARLKALGNAIVPQVAMEIFRAIKEADDQ